MVVGWLVCSRDSHRLDEHRLVIGLVLIEMVEIYTPRVLLAGRPVFVQRPLARDLCSVFPTSSPPRFCKRPSVCLLLVGFHSLSNLRVAKLRNGTLVSQTSSLNDIVLI